MKHTVLNFASKTSTEVALKEFNKPVPAQISKA